MKKFIKAYGLFTGIIFILSAIGLLFVSEFIQAFVSLLIGLALTYRCLSNEKREAVKLFLQKYTHKAESLTLNDFTFKQGKSSGIFIPNGNSFKELTSIEKTSINNIAKHLGYNQDMIYSYFGSLNDDDSVIKSVVFEIFTNNIIFVYTSEDTIFLSNAMVQKYMRHFDFKTEFDAVKVEGILEDGIENATLTYDYLKKVLSLNPLSEKSSVLSPRLDLVLQFENGILTGFQSSDGLNSWAKYWKSINSSLFESYKREAEHFWGKQNTTSVIREINAQAECFASTPQALDNPNCALHRSIFNNINFANLLLAHHGETISISDFITLNHGRYKKVSDNQYIVGQFIYGFSDDGSFTHATQVS